MAIWDEAHECMDRERLEAFQLERLRELVGRVRGSVPFYRGRLDDAGLAPGDLTCLDDVRRLPFTQKADFRHEYPRGMFAVPGREVVEVHSTSGTTGRPVVCGFTARDLETWAELVCRLAVAVGVGRDDVAQVTLGYGMFTGGFGLHYGLQRAGAQVLPVSSGNTERQIRLMRDLGTTVLIATPTYALHLGDVLRDSGVTVDELSLRLGLFGAEACTDEMRTHIEAMLPLVATDNYGLTEVLGPGVAGECECRAGMHVNEDHFVVECLDPETDRPVPDGELGELVFTALTRECSPVLRYRTHDISSVTRAGCDCGRTTARIGKVVGRTDEMFIINGVNVFPSAVEKVLFATGGVRPFYRIVLERRDGLDTFDVQVEVEDELFSGPRQALLDLERRLTAELKDALLVRPGVTLLRPGCIEASAGKTRRVFDRREG